MAETYSGKPCKLGHTLRYASNYVCVECAKINKAIYIVKNKNKLSQDFKKYRFKNLDKIRANIKRWREANREKTRFHNRQYKHNNSNKICAINAKRRANQLQRTPTWANLENLKQIYLHCPIGYHVDHIIPLQGKYVSGLHVEENLQYLPALENISKGNKYGTN